ncbi:hypothetical protein AQULUS_00840 [Aquicella lusitana]|uniref:Uncharacterized protein n=1 Tax=Aquicella lusitana TaxID=254246 RepID=A0A370G3B7_9COXI|nr:hypothetical protein C8D86_1331 [Aquicella lusitana]VVC72374.1 hypothetical protein AQULUS_00840 [Aquicella lusitana]
MSLADDIRGLRERNLNTAGTTDTLTKWGEDYKKIIDALPTLIQKKIDEKEATLQYWQNAKKAYEQTPKVHKVY